MEKEKSLKPSVYYLSEVEDENGNISVIVSDKGEYMVPYVTKEIIDKDGRVHIIFWKKSNKSTFDA